jgi:hypothetical protein
LRRAITILTCLAAQTILGGVAVAGPLSAESQKAYDTKVRPFLQAHCFKCHDAKVTRAGFRIDTLGIDFLAGKTADHWKEIYDHIGAGEMPPRKEPRPDAKQATEVTDWIIQELRNAEERAKNSSGRIPTRRLNRTEYANTLASLFYLDDNYARGLEDDLPMDGKVGGFDRGGAGLFIDESQLATYLETADLVLDREVFGPRPKQVQAKYLVRDARRGKDGCLSVSTWLSGHQNAGKPGAQRRIPLGASSVDWKKGGAEFLQKTAEEGQEDPEGSLAVPDGYWYRYADPFSTSNFQDGWYRLKFRAGAFKGTGSSAVDDVKISFRYAQNTAIEVTETVVIDAPLDKPRDFEMKVFLRAGSPQLQRSYRLTWNGMPGVVIRNPVLHQLEREWYDKFKFHNLLQRLTAQKRPPAEIDEAKQKIEEFHNYYHKSVMELKVARVYNPKVDLQVIPRLWIESFEIEGPITTWPTRGRTELFFAGEERKIDKQYLRDIFARFLPRAYRRPVEPKELDDLVAWVLKTQEANGLSGSEAVKEGVKAVLCSPDFLLIREPTGTSSKPRKLTDHELASRLSYFLWSTMPDAELFALAAANKLHEPKALHAQVRRMLADPKGTGLVRNFAGQWLKVHDFSSVPVDRRQYPAYDDELRKSSMREPYEFFKEVLRDDRSILNFVDSDFLVVDERLATHYGIAGVKGNAFRKVAIRPEHRRGGVLGMAGVLTFLSDGTRTLPVRRAAYVLDTLWNAPPPPPPPSAGELPRVGRNLTVRQRLEQHRSSPICASCHARIDPFGMALENYDAIGTWRERQNGERLKGDLSSPALDVSGVLPGGRPFKSLQEFKQALLAEKERFVRGFVEKLLTYALGRPVGATDRETIAEIIKAVEPEAGTDEEKYRLQSLIQAIVSSQVFRMK